MADRKTIVSIVATLVGLATSIPAAATNPTFGSGGILTNRACVQTAGTDCVLGPRTFGQFAGGLGSTFTISATNENNAGASGFASVAFGEGYLPTIKAASFAGSNTRTGASADAFRAFTYSGSQAINLVLAATIHYVTSGSLSAQGETIGGGFMNANLGILPLSALGEFGTDGIDIISASGAGFTDCGGGALAASYVGSRGTTGENTKLLSLSTTCSGNAITLHSGDSFIVYAGLQAISNSGGFLDASHTFSVFYDPINTVFTDTGESVGAAFFAANIAAVPEPGVWTMMILGFGASGLALRHHRRFDSRVFIR